MESSVDWERWLGRMALNTSGSSWTTRSTAEECTWASSTLSCGEHSEVYSLAGSYTNEKGDVYEGDFEHNIPQGEGDLVLANGDKYVGEFKNGIPHGMGEYTFTNGDVYIGEMDNDEFHGFGEYKGASGSTYVGEFVRGSKVRHRARRGYCGLLTAFDTGQ